MLLAALAVAAITIVIVSASGSAQPSLATTGRSSAADAAAFQWGDTDCNGTIDTQDLLRVLRQASALQVDPACDPASQSPGPQPTDSDVVVSVNPTAILIPAGETRSVDIVADVNNGPIGSWLVTVQYDPAVVTPVFCSGACNFAFGPDEIAMANAPFTPVSGSSVLASVTFEATSPAGQQSSVSVTQADLTDTNGDPLSARLSNGTITIAVSREDLDCRSGVTAQDALDLLSYIAGLPTADHPSGCPALGE